MKPIILIVDDSDIQRQLIGGLLKQESDYDIRFAWDGQDACDYLKNSPADLVLTDLLMPGIDGLALIGRLRDTHPDIPVALVTAHGNEEIAADALRRGAVNYVSKSELKERLAPTVRQIVHRVQFDQQKLHTAKRLDSVRLDESLANDLSLVEPSVDIIHRELIALYSGDRTDRVGICIALAEALTNAILHGNLEITREELAAAAGSGVSLDRIVHERLALPDLAQRRVTLHAEISADTARFTVRDEGAAFDAEQGIAQLTNDFLERGHARGLILMQSLMDELMVDPTTHEVVLLADLRGSCGSS